MKLLAGFSLSNSLVSRIIARVTKGSVSHAFFIFDEIPFVEHELYQANAKGFGMSTREELTRGSTRIIQEIELPVDPMRVLQICRKRLGTPYAYLALFGMLWVQLGIFLGQRWRNPVRSVHHMFCSEEMVEILQEAGLPSVQGLDAVSVSPEALQAFFEARYGTSSSSGRLFLHTLH